MVKAKILPKQKKSSKNTLTLKANSGLIAYDPIKEITNQNFIGKAILECLINNDPEGVMEVIKIYLETLEKIQVKRFRFKEWT